jgi:pimeloyl-ACP methyl ester carboxylesterase
LAAEKLLRAKTEPVTIAARDGQQLVGHWYPCAGARRLVLAMHGWRSAWNRDFGMIADFLHENGCSILFAEQRGQGSSGGACMGLGALERYDCADWAAWLAAREPERPIYLAGISMGAATVLLAAGLKLPDSVRGIIADCGFTSPYDIGRHVVRNNLHMSFSLRARAADRLCRRKNNEGIRSCSTVDALRSTHIPVLLIHGTDDSFVPVSMTYENYKACAGPKELLVVPGADHGMSYFVDRRRYEETLKAFWNRFDKAG